MDTIEVPAYPSNSRKDRGDEPKDIPKSDVDSIVPSAKATPIAKERGFIQRISDDAPEVRDFFIYDIFLPAAKNLVSEIVHSTVDAVRRSVDESLYGHDRGYNTVRDHGRSYISYDKISKRDRGGRHDSRISGGGITKRSSFSSPNDVPIDSRMKAERILSDMFEIIKAYDQATVGDFYDLAGVTSESFTDRKWGWKNLGEAYVERGSDGYYVKMPDPKPL